MSNCAAWRFSCADGLNSWAGTAGNCETTYEWEVVTSPGLQPVAFSSQPIQPCAGNSLCTGTGASRACNGILADITSLQGKCRRSGLLSGGVSWQPARQCPALL